MAVSWPGKAPHKQYTVISGKTMFGSARMIDPGKLCPVLEIAIYEHNTERRLDNLNVGALY